MSLSNKQNIIAGGSENVKHTHSSGENANVNKRGASAIDVGDGKNKKPRIELSDHSLTLSKLKAKGITEHVVNVDLLNITSGASGSERNSIIIESSESLASNEGSSITLNATASGEDDDLVIRKFDSTVLSDMVPTSPLQLNELTDDYVLFATDVMDYVDSDDFTVTTTAKSITTSRSNVDHISQIVPTTANLEPLLSSTASTKTINTSHKDFSESTVPYNDISEGINMLSSSEKTNTDEGDLLTLQHLQAVKETKVAEVATKGDGAPTRKNVNILTGFTTISSSSSSRNIISPNSVTYSRNTNVSRASTPSQYTSPIINRVSIQSALKNQPLVVTTKKLMSEVTQTTAKVSIGNTTISVPLLKPLNSTHVIQSGGVVGEISKQGNQPQQLQSKTQVNLSKILNVKRNQKIKQPTIVSLSQLQIKPVSTAKIVQAKVVSKKLPQVTTSAISTSGAQLQPNTCLVTVTSSKSKHGNVYNSYPKMTQISELQDLALPETLLEEETVGSDTGNSSIATATNNMEHAAEMTQSSEAPYYKNLQKLLLNKIKLSENKTIVAEDSSGQHQKNTIDTSEKATTTTVKKIIGSANTANIPSFIKPLLKHKDQCSIAQQLTNNMGPAISIVKQTLPQLVASHATTVGTNSVLGTESKLQMELLAPKIPLSSLSTTVAKTNSTPLIAIPRNISLMMTKSNLSQQSKTSIAVATNTSVSNAINTAQKLNVTSSNTFNITATSVAPPSCVHIETSSSSSFKPAVISVAVKTASMELVGDTSHQESQQQQQQHQQQQQSSNKMLKITPCTINALSQPTNVAKRCKSSDDRDERESNTTNSTTFAAQISRHNLEVLSAHKRNILTESESKTLAKDEIASNSSTISATTTASSTTTSSSSSSTTSSSLNISVSEHQRTDENKFSMPPSFQQSINNQQQHQHQHLHHQHHPHPHAHHQPSTYLKTEETNNVLLKQLLQNSTSSSSTSVTSLHNTTISTILNTQTTAASVAATTATTITSAVSTSSTGTSSTADTNALCTQVLSARKVINIRAPSLGLVSSLEAQLARPVIPPVPANVTATNAATEPVPAEALLSTQKHANSENLLKPSTEYSVTAGSGVVHHTDGTKLKPSVQIISKETSFVSNPYLNTYTSSDGTAITHGLTSTTTTAMASSGTTANIIAKPKDIQQPTNVRNQPANIIMSTTEYSGGGGMPTTNDTAIKSENNNTSSISSIAANNNITIYSRNTATSRSSAMISSANTTTSSIGIKLNLPPNTQCTSTTQMPSYSHKQQAENPNNHSENLKNTNTKSATTPLLEVRTTSANILQHQQQQQKQQQSVQCNVETPTSNSTENTNMTKTSQTTGSASAAAAAAVAAAAVAAATAAEDKLNCKAKDADIRKKRKREYQKHRRQLLNINKYSQIKQTSTGNASGAAGTSASGGAASVNSGSSAASNVHAKKRPRKLSKIEEDHDSYIDNLMVHIRQMQPLQVVEPLLNRSFGICGLYGRSVGARGAHNNNSTREPDEQVFHEMLMGEYGNAYRPHVRVSYNGKGGSCSSHSSNISSNVDESDDEKQPNSVIHNDFYDQEFKPIIYRSDYNKLTRFVGQIRERNIEALDTIGGYNSTMVGVQQSPNNCTMNNKWNTIAPVLYPGLTVLNRSFNHYLGRTSPVIPHIDPMALMKKRAIFPLKPLVEELKTLHIKEEKEQMDFLEYKTSDKSEEESNRQPTNTVILTLPSSTAETIFGVLKDLANLLYISPPTSYKVIESSDRMLSKHCLGQRQKRLAHKKGGQLGSLQQILNNRRKMCRNCGHAIKMGMRAERNKIAPTENVSISIMDSATMAKPIFFCNKSCYMQFIWHTRNSMTSSAAGVHTKVVATTTTAAGIITNTNTTSTTTTTTTNRTNMSSGGMDCMANSGVEQKYNIDNVRSSNEQRFSSAEAANSERMSKKCGFKYFSSNCFNSSQFKRVNSKEVTDILHNMDITLSVAPNVSDPVPPMQQSIEDIRQCVLCSQRGDGLPDGPSRLLNFDVDKWVHLNCALWSNGVYETISGGLMNFQTALQVGLNQTCSACHKIGATIKCFKNRCCVVLHLPCAVKEQCVFYKNKTIHCQPHAPRTEKENELTSLVVQRRVFVERDENCQVAAVMHQTELPNLLRVGSLTFLNVGQLLPHQLEAFHTPNHIYPIGYRIIRFYWSMKRINKRCRYICSIAEVAGRPEFRIQLQESMENDVELRDASPKAVWQRILEPIAALRKQHGLVHLFPEFITGEDLFGLTEPSIVRIIESLPGIETLTDYRFKYGRNPLLELPLAINPTGAARTEPKQRQLLGWRKPHTQRTGSTYNQRVANPVVAGEVACPYSKQFVHSKSSQYKKMKQEWRNNVYLARSKIQGLGLYAARDMEKHTMIIEYIGEVIRTEVSEIREKMYESRNRGIYMFRLDEDRVVDATLSGGLARYINHSCNPNCVTEIVEVDREIRIIIFAKRRINRGEELSYDYKFDIEDDANKIACMCGAPNCRKWMN